MAKKIAMPTLTAKGWLYNQAEIIDMALAHMFVSDYSQSNLHHGQITSFSWLVAKYGNEPAVMASELEDVLSRYLNAYSERANVVVKYDFVDKQGVINKAKYNLFIRLEVFQNGERYALDKEIEVIDSKFKVITGVLNE